MLKFKNMSMSKKIITLFSGITIITGIVTATTSYLAFDMIQTESNRTFNTHTTTLNTAHKVESELLEYKIIVRDMILNENINLQTSADTANDKFNKFKEDANSY